ncbi:bifunctional SulP family inorganic anion transporter/carbonic anhydrase [Frankia sp. EI5c]|uniref:SulP family inorganic anion transporter n=1 Tax=Frankia sp. EI5c TaxID=683316 RepID=UPI001F5B2628|nr:bifunctional SulP family inorganic anion transporter/carbonic anhydrase [Frankia sp. EI5c]
MTSTPAALPYPSEIDSRPRHGPAGRPPSGERTTSSRHEEHPSFPGIEEPGVGILAGRGGISTGPADHAAPGQPGLADRTGLGEPTDADLADPVAGADHAGAAGTAGTAAAAGRLRTRPAGRAPGGPGGHRAATRGPRRRARGAASAAPAEPAAVGSAGRGHGSPRGVWRADLEASVVVFLVALPLSLGIAVASGAPVVAGIIAAVVGGIVAGALGGVPLQVSGPAAGLTAVVAEIVLTHGWRVACFVTAAAGVVQVLLGLSRVARAALAISPAVVHGMLAGIGLTIVIGQLHVVLGGTAGSSAWDNLVVLPGELASPAVPAAALLGLITIVLTVLWPRLPRPVSAVPAPLAAVSAATVVSLPFDVPRVSLPDNLLGAIALPELPTGGAWGAVVLSVLTVALVASIESLLSAVAVEAMHSGPRGDLDRELLGQGAANTLSGLLGGLPVTGVIVRSSTNVQAGARSRRSAILHGLWMAGFALLLAPVVVRIPLAVLAGLLVVIGIRLVDLAHIRAIARHGELAIYLTTVLGVVLLNLLEGVLLGIATALLLALRRTLVAPVHVHPPTTPGSPWRVVVEGALTFLSLPRLSRRLAEVPPGAPVRLDLATDYLDHGAHSMLDGWIAERHRAGAAVTVDPVGTGPLALPSGPVGPQQGGFLSSLLGVRPGGRHARAQPPRWLAPWSSWQHGQDHDRRHLLNGVDEFHHRTAPMIEPYLTELTAGQSPSTLFITCSDSRLVPNVITSSGPGDLFTVRTPGAFVPGPQTVGDSTLAAIEYAVAVLGVRTIAVCGHSGCGAVNALFDRDALGAVPGAESLRNLRAWLRHGEPAVARAERAAGGLPADADELSRISVAQQLVALRELSVVRRAEAAGRLHLVGMWFDIATARAIVLDEATDRFEVPSVSLAPALESGQRLADATGS